MAQDGGVYAMDQLEEDCRKWREGTLSMGKHYWQDFRKHFRDPNSPWSKLEPKNAEDEVLQEALERVFENRANFIPFQEWCMSVGAINQKTVCACDRAMLLPPAARSYENSESMVMSMEMTT